MNSRRYHEAIGSEGNLFIPLKSPEGAKERQAHNILCTFRKKDTINHNRIQSGYHGPLKYFYYEERQAEKRQNFHQASLGLGNYNLKGFLKVIYFGYL